jgi:hypothetical protein
VIVVVDVLAQANSQFVEIPARIEVIKLGLERSEEALHSRIIQAVTFARHALLDRVML